MSLRSINDTRLWIEDTGAPPSGAGETLVFSHGLLFNTKLFEAQIASLRDRYRCVAYDHRGQGRSEASDLSSIPMELLYQDAVAILDALNLPQVHFVGLSMGGFIGMRLAARRPDRVRSLILLETSADPEPRENVLRYRAMSMVARAFGVKPLASRVAKIMFAKSALADPSRSSDVARWTAILMGNSPQIYRAVNGVIDRVGIYPELGRIRCPTLIGVGEEDVATVPAKSERIHRAIAGSTLVRFPRAGHSSALETPEAVTRAIEEHLARTRADIASIN